MIKNYYVYMLKCRDNSYYTGITNDLERRFQEHQTGYNQKCYTFFRRPVDLVYTDLFNDIQHAITCEKRLKKWSRKKKEALINFNIDELKELAKRRTPDKPRK